VALAVHVQGQSLWSGSLKLNAFCICTTWEVGHFVLKSFWKTKNCRTFGGHGPLSSLTGGHGNLNFMNIFGPLFNTTGFIGSKYWKSKSWRYLRFSDAFLWPTWIFKLALSALTLIGFYQIESLWLLVHNFTFVRSRSVCIVHACVKTMTGIFKIEDSAYVARLWGKRKNRPAMNYDKLSRSIRQYYRKGIIRKTDCSRRLVYQFCPKYLWVIKHGAVPS